MAPELKYYDFDEYNNMITILVGSPDKHLRQTRVLAPVGLLSAQSGFFKAACKIDWRTGREMQIDLQHVKKEAFEIFMAWLNYSNIEQAKSWTEVKPRDLPSKRLDDRATQWSTLCDCYILADSIIAPRFANVIIDAMVTSLMRFEAEETSDSISPLCNKMVETIDLVWNTTPTQSPIRRLVMDSLTSTRHTNPEKTAKSFKKIGGSVKSELVVPVEFMLDFIEHQGHTIKKRYSTEPWNIASRNNRPCAYHIHDDGELCNKNRKAWYVSSSHIIGKSFGQTNDVLIDIHGGQWTFSAPNCRL